MARNDFLVNAIGRLFPGWARRQQGFQSTKSGRRGRKRRSLGLGVGNNDVEAGAAPPRRFAEELVQGMQAPDDGEHHEEEHQERGGERGIDTSMTEDERDALLDALMQRQSTQSEAEKQEEKQEQELAIQSICKATSAEGMFLCMDVMIKEDWLGGLDELPGNIYSVAALTIGKMCTPTTDPLAMSKRLGFFLIFIIQLFGPVLIFFQLTTNRGIEAPDQIQWEKFHLEFPFSSDWTGEKKATKFVSWLFVSVFFLNGVFCHIDEANSWRKVDKIFRVLDHNGSMKGTSEAMLKLGAFMNCWVIFWLELDVFIAVGTSQSVFDVLMDALGLTFLFNIDDIGGDFGFVDHDDWPGVQLAWVYDNIGEAAKDLSDIDEVEASQACDWFLWLFGKLLGLTCLLGSLITIWTPWYQMDADPWYEGSPAEISAYLANLASLANTTR
jgi:hypothetical protein